MRRGNSPYDWLFLLTNRWKLTLLLPDKSDVFVILGVCIRCFVEFKNFAERNIDEEVISTLDHPLASQLRDNPFYVDDFVKLWSLKGTKRPQI